MVSLQASTLLLNPSCYSSSFPSSKRISCAIHAPKASTTKPVQELLGHKLEKNEYTTKILHGHDIDISHNSTTWSYNKATIQLYAILEAIADRIEMHNNLGEQRDNWNTLLLNSVNMITLTASTMAGIAGIESCNGASLVALKVTSALLFTAATGMLLVINKIQPSQLAEEQRNSTRLFKQLQTQIQNKISLGNNPSEEDVTDAMEKVLALDKAYPLPLLGVMLEKFPKKFEPAIWWPNSNSQGKNGLSKEMMKNKNSNTNGWNEELESDMREIIEVVNRKDIEDYERLGNIALKVNKGLAISGPLLSGIAAIGCGFLGDETSWASLVPVLAGALATVVNAFEHGGQVGMVFEMYRNCGGFFRLLTDTIEATLEEKDLEKRENGELFEIKMALQLGRSVSQLRQLASKSASYRTEGTELDEFASKLF